MIRRPPRSTLTDTLFPYTTLFRSLLPSGLCTQTISPSRTPLLLASTGLISTNMFCWSSASHGLDRVSSPPPSYSTSRPEVRMIVKRSEEHTSELQSLMRISYAVFCLKKKKNKTQESTYTRQH